METVTDEKAYQAAREAAAVVRASRDVLRIVGEDRSSFLHGMVTNDVNGLAVGQWTYAAMCTPKGQMVGDARIWKREADLVLDTEPGQGAAVKAFLDKYLISEDAEVQVAEDLAVLRLLGPKAEALAPRVAGSLTAPSLLAGRPGVDVLAARASLPALSLPELDEPTYEVLRVEAGIPRYGRDMDEATIPLEANLERAIHYNKGCYIGQEVIARATFRGHMNRKLAGLVLGSAEPAAKTELRSADKKVGWVTSVVRSPALGQNAALGYVHRDFLEPGTRLQLASGGEVEVRALPLTPA